MAAETKKQSGDERISLKDCLRMHLRALSVLRQRQPGLLPSSALLAVLEPAAPLVTVFFSARVIEELAGPRRPEALLRWALLTVLVEAVLALVTAMVRHWRNPLCHPGIVWNDHDFLIAERAMTMDYADFDRQETQDMAARILQSMNWRGLGMPRVLEYFTGTLRAVIGIVGSIGLTAGLLASRVPASAGAWTALDHPLALLALLLFLAAMATLSPLMTAKAGLWEQSEAMADQATLGNRIFNFFGGLSLQAHRMLDIRMYHQATIARWEMRNNPFGMNGPFAQLARGKGGAVNAVAAALSAAATGGVYVYVCLKAWAGAFGVGLVTQYVSAVTTLTGHVTGLFQQLAEMRRNAPYLQLTFEYLDLPSSMYQGSLTTEKRADREYDVEFRDVSFHYPGSERWALRHVSVKFKVGQRLAVVGENGSGKTTFIKLLCRLYDPQEGQILLNGIDIRKYDPADYRGVFSVVFQDFQLLSQPLGANVAGAAACDRERAEACLRDAGFADRLAELPDGLDTMLYRDFNGEGVDVSGGEAQKIAIARALYKNAPFIILDEPTAALDPMAEAEIYAKFNEISGDKTAIYISHRLSSCRFCDEILVFDQGNIVQRGSHDNLLADETGKYHALWHAQAQYYDPAQA